MTDQKLLLEINLKVTRIETMLSGNGGKGVLSRLDDLEAKPKKQLARYVSQITIAVGLVMAFNVVGRAVGWW